MARTATPTPRRTQTRRSAAPQTRRTTTTRRPTSGTPRQFPGRRKPQQSGAQKVLGSLTSALPIGGGKSKVKGKSSAGGAAKKGGPAGLLILGAGAFAALKNRDKLKGKLPGGSKGETDVEYVTPAAPTAPVATSPDGAPLGGPPAL